MYAIKNTPKVNVDLFVYYTYLKGIALALSLLARSGE